MRVCAICWLVGWLERQQLKIWPNALRMLVDSGQDCDNGPETKRQIMAQRRRQAQRQRSACLFPPIAQPGKAEIVVVRIFGNDNDKDIDKEASLTIRSSPAG